MKSWLTLSDLTNNKIFCEISDNELWGKYNNGVESSWRPAVPKSHKITYHSFFFFFCCNLGRVSRKCSTYCFLLRYLIFCFPFVKRITGKKIFSFKNPGHYKRPRNHSYKKLSHKKMPIAAFCWEN